MFLAEDVLTMKIYGGRDAAAHSRPYMALVERRLHDGSLRYCGGFLLNKNFVMTAAHCHGKSFVVTLGLHNYSLDEKRQIIPVETAFPSKLFKQDTPHDLMLLKLSDEANLGETVQPIKFACQVEETLPKLCSVAGWGSNKKLFNMTWMTNVLQEINVTLVENSMCTDGNFFCSMDEAGPRRGDSGGPLVCQGGEVYGVISKAIKLHGKEPPLYTYTNICADSEWIHSIMKKIKVVE